MAKLYHTAEILKKGGALTVGYIGGSITEGAGASEDGKCWRALTTDWLRKTYPNSEINEIDATIGGTGSDLGLFRCGHDMLSYRPDLVFIEFAVNDGGNDYETERLYMESLIRKIRVSVPRADIILVFTVTPGCQQAVSDGNFAPVNAQTDLAARYGLLTADVGKALLSEMRKSGKAWKDFSGDNCHPNDAGYLIYFKEVKRVLEDALDRRPQSQESGSPDGLPVPSGSVFTEAGLIDCWGAALSGFEKSAVVLPGNCWNEDLPGYEKHGRKIPENRFPHTICSDRPGDCFMVAFTGTTAGLYYRMSADAGMYAWSIDGSAPEKASTFDRFSKVFDRSGYRIFTRSLLAGRHTLKITVLGEKDEESAGRFIRAGAVLYGTEEKAE